MTSLLCLEKGPITFDETLGKLVSNCLGGIVLLMQIYILNCIISNSSYGTISNSSYGTSRSIYISKDY